MPVKSVRRSHSRAPRHKHTKSYLQTYWPYLPMLAIVLIGLFFGGSRPFSVPSSGTLAYATDVSLTGLLSATNSQRGSNGKSSLKLNQQLINAAQAKANDMVARNYWSHTTPDGQQPWVFIQNAGYKYTKAGENLAYGFATSSDTVTGWMNSTSHKANMLDSAFSEVGFGISNAPDYNSSGNQTVVVAMYAQPQVLASAPASSPAPATKPSTKTTKPVETVSNPPKTEDKKPEPAAEKPSVPVPATTEQAIVEASKTVSRAQLLTRGTMPWVLSGLSLMMAVGLVVLLARHGWGFRRLLQNGEDFVLTHPVIDTIIVTLIMIGYVLSATKGIIQ